MFYKINSTSKIKGKLFVSAKFLKNHRLVSKDSVVIIAGGRTDKVEVIITPNLKENEVIISDDTIKTLSIPENMNYQILTDKNTIKIGPVIGLLMGDTLNSLSRGRLKKLLDYCIIYPEIQGLILAISEEGIDFDKKLVKGYCYNPEANGKEPQWIQGEFPFPDSIFQRIDLSETLRMRLKQETNNRLFNSNYFNKWEFWNMVSSFKEFLKFIPDTRLFSSIDDIDTMLSQYGSVYLKPISGTLSRGLYKVISNNGKYDFKGNKGAEITTIDSKDAAEKYLANIIGNRHYIVQQAIKPIMVDGRHMDFRVIMQKDHTMAWGCTGVIGFIGGKDDICSNWGYTSIFEDIFSTHFNLNQQQIFKKKQELIAACKSICDVLDLRDENYGDFGFDVVVDENMQVWVLEVNKRHYHTIPLWVNDVQTFYEVKSKPIKYAAALGGFEVY